MPVHPAASVGRLPSARSGHSCTALPAHLVARLSPGEDGEDGQDGEDGGEGLVVFGGCRGASHGEHGNRKDSTLNDAHVPVLSAPPRWLELLYLHVPSLQNHVPWLHPGATRVGESPAAGRAVSAVVHVGPCVHALTWPTEISSEITSEITSEIRRFTGTTAPKRCASLSSSRMCRSLASEIWMRSVRWQRLQKD